MTQEQTRALQASLFEMMESIEQKNPILEQLDTIGKLQMEIEATAPAQLNHFLQNRSYAKALEFLKNGTIIEVPNRPECDEEEAHP